MLAVYRGRIDVRSEKFQDRGHRLSVVWYSAPYHLLLVIIGCAAVVMQTVVRLHKHRTLASCQRVHRGNNPHGRITAFDVIAELHIYVPFNALDVLGGIVVEGEDAF